MNLKNKKCFILIGNDRTGKTTFQKHLIRKIALADYGKRLDCNLDFSILNPDMQKRYESIFFINRSYQEKKEEYKSVHEYFEKYFKDTDICVLSSHLVVADVAEMINEAKARFYNVAGVFFSNSIEAEKNLNSEISKLDWNKRIVLENPLVESGGEDEISWQIEKMAEYFTNYLLKQD